MLFQERKDCKMDSQNRGFCRAWLEVKRWFQTFLKSERIFTWEFWGMGQQEIHGYKGTFTMGGGASHNGAVPG